MHWNSVENSCQSSCHPFKIHCRSSTFEVLVCTSSYPLEWLFCGFCAIVHMKFWCLILDLVVLMHWPRLPKDVALVLFPMIASSRPHNYNIVLNRNSKLKVAWFHFLTGTWRWVLLHVEPFLTCWLPEQLVMSIVVCSRKELPNKLLF